MSRYSFKKIARALGVVVLSAIGIGFGGRGAIAQNAIIPDNTLGREASIIQQPFGPSIDVITGGVARGENLFHSFEEFSVRNQGAYFFSPSAEIQSIFSRVTGDNISEIFGTLGTYGNSTPDLWLINPNGILFGPNSRLDIGGSFVASTANAVQIDGKINFEASEIAESINILTINDSVLLFNSLSNARIENQSQADVVPPEVFLSGFREFRGLQVPNGQSLTLASSDIFLNGGGLNALNGNIGLFSLNNVSLAGGATVQAGNILIETNQLSVEDGSQILTQFVDSRVLENVSIIDEGETQSFVFTPDEKLRELPVREGGNLSISAQESVNISGETADGNNSSRIGAGALGLMRSGGNIYIQTGSLALQNGGQITSNYVSISERNEGGGNVSINAELIGFSGESTAGRRQSGILIGNGFPLPTNGSISLFSKEFNLLNGAQIRVDLNTVTDSENSQSIPDNININSSNILISGLSLTGIPSTISTGASLFADQRSSINLDTETLTLQEGGRINGFLTNLTANAITLRDNSVINSEINRSLRQAPGVVINADEVNLQDTSEIHGRVDIQTNRLALQQSSSISGIFSFTNKIELPNGLEGINLVGPTASDLFGLVGDIDISANTLALQDNAVISSDSIRITGNNIALTDQSRILGSRGIVDTRAGNIFIHTDQLDVLDSSQISTSIAGRGSGGTIEIIAENAINIIGDPTSSQPSSIIATSGGPGSGGNISLETNRLQIQNGSQLAASINGGGTGGTVNIRAVESVIVEGVSNSGTPSRISAESNLNGGEFGVLRSIRANNQLPQNIFVRLNGQISVFTASSGTIRSIPKNGDPDGTELNISGYEDGIFNGSVFVARFSSSGANQVTIVNPYVPRDGALLIGQSFGTDFEDSIQGGRLIRLEDTATSSEATFFLNTLELIANNRTEERELESSGISKLDILNDVNDVKNAFVDNAGEFYIIESTGNEFRIQDGIYTDTSFLDIQPGDLFLVFAVRDGGDINIETGELIIRDGAEISTAFIGAAEGRATASNLDIVADSVLLENNATLSSVSGTGSGGNISIRTSGLTLNNNSAITASAVDNANGGNVTINAQNGIVRTNDSNILSSSARAGGGNVTINASGIRLEGDSDIQTNVVTGGGDGGNIDLTANYIIAFDDSDILANAEGGRGGRINLRTPGFFGASFTLTSLQANPDTLDNNSQVDINATGSVNGIVTVPDVSFLENGLTSLPDTLIAPEQLIANSCIARADDGQGTLVTSGGGGLTSGPSSDLTVPFSTGAVQVIPGDISASTETTSTESDVSITEPTGIYQLADGRLVMSQECL
jgi:filamentous hemagglutinin family protein